MPRQALLVTFDEHVDSQLARTALEDLLRKGALRWVGMEGNNVQVWRTVDISRTLQPPRLIHVTRRCERSLVRARLLNGAAVGRMVCLDLLRVKSA